MSYVFLIWFAVIGVFFYFTVIKNQKRQRTAVSDLQQHLVVGSEVRTNAHILGTVTEIGDEWVVVETTPGVKIKIGKPAIVAIILPDDPEDDEDNLIGTTVADPAYDAVSEPAGSDVQDAVPSEVATDAVPDTAESAEIAEHASKS